MLGLVQYDSDEDSEQEAQQPAPAPVASTTDKVALSTAHTKPSTNNVKQDNISSDVTAQVADAPPTIVVPVSKEGPSQGPQGPPSAPQNDSSTFGPMRPPSVEMTYPASEHASDNGEPASQQLSPYSHKRSLLRAYTIPTLDSDFSIPESPPGSPPAGTSKQFASFLALKKKDVHFNQKLSQTTALRNPNLLENLMKHVGIDSVGQYVSNWSKDIWNPNPEYLGLGIEKRRGETAVQALARLQKEDFEKRQLERTTVEFVGSGVQQVESTAAKGAQAPVSAAERIMSGLDRERKSSPAIPRRDGQGPSSRRDEERDRDRDRDRNRNRDEGRRDRYREDSDRYKRPRSRSRERSRDRQRYRERDYNRR